MLARFFFLLQFVFILNSFAFSNGLKFQIFTKKVIEAHRIDEHLRIDGILDETSWSNASIAKDFLQYEPFNGSFPSEKTEVKILYDNSAIYIGAILYDSEPQNIFKELGQRDNSDKLKSDAFSLLISPYNDGINFQEFLVSASGVQTDIRHTGNNTDRSWNAVWDSKVSMNDSAWVVEMRIPFSALRFSSKSNSKWGINFRRLIKRYNEWSSWNAIDNSISGIVNQSGELTGIKDVDSPIRLSFSPYISAYAEKFPDTDLNYRFNGGMDLKFGISEGFTLDMTLIPDFGQVKSDDKVLNISPFEVKYNEQRPFFTEGMDLFSKGGIFYTRRIGSQPRGYNNVYNELAVNEIVLHNPVETGMVNATKISGRTSGGLGIAFFNAITSKTKAEILDTISGTKREFITQGITNYNMFVLDQTLPNNSYVSIANTNLLHPHASYTSNVSATEFILRNKRNSYAIKGAGAVSQIFNDSLNLGFTSFVSLNKTSGNFLFSTWNNIESDRYNPNDMGYLQNPNEISSGIEFGYKKYKPFWKVLNLNSWLGFSYATLYKPTSYNQSSIYLNANTTFTKNYLTVGINFSLNPRETHDYFEARTPGRMLIKPRIISGGLWTSSDYRKPFALDIRTSFWKGESFNYSGMYISVSPRFRFSNNFMLIYEIRQDFDFNNLGYAGKSNGEIYMGLRDISTLTNTLNGLYSFTSTSNLNLRVRHYWRWIDYSSYHSLNNNGTISEPLVDHNLDKNINFNLFNIDLTYQWNFAPGSELAIVWKNAIEVSNSKVHSHFISNFEDVLNANQLNSLSIKILYYLDYHDIKKSYKKNQ